MEFFTFRLPVKKHIQKFFNTLYGDPIPVSMETDFGFVILNTLASRFEAKVCRGYNNQFEDPYRTSLIFQIPVHYFYYTKKEISVYTSILLNRYLENKFEKDMCSWIDTELKLSIGITRKKAIEQFTEAYNIEIETDISFDALKKMEYRHRKKNIDIFLRRLSPAV